MPHSPSTASPQGRQQYSDLELYTPPALRPVPHQNSVDHGPEVYQYSDVPHVIHPDKGPVPVTAMHDFEDPIRSQLRQSLVCGLPRKRFWMIAGVLGLLVVIAAGVGGGVGSYLSRPKNSSHNNSVTSSNNTAAAVVDMSIASMHWVDSEAVSQYRVYVQPINTTRIVEASWSASSAQEQWLVSAITTDNADIKPHSPLTAMAGHAGANASSLLKQNLYYITSNGTVIEEGYQNQVIGDWFEKQLNGYTADEQSALSSYWYEDLDNTGVMYLVVFFQELGANSLSSARYVQNNSATDPITDWTKKEFKFPVADGSPMANAPVGSGLDLNLYLGDLDGKMLQYPYDVRNSAFGNPTATDYDLKPGTPICVSTQDNRNYFTDETLPDCTKTGTNPFLTHLILFASEDRKNLSLVSWNCSSGFVSAKDRIDALLLPNRTYLGLTTTSSTSTFGSNSSFSNQRVYVAFAGGNGPEIEEWQIPNSGGVLNAVDQEAGWKLLGNVPFSTS